MPKFLNLTQLNPSSNGWLRLAIVLICGLLMGCTPAPINAWWLAWIALAPLWVLMFSTLTPAQAEPSVLGPRPRQPNWLLPFAWGIGYHGLALSWITGLHPLTWMGIPWLASLAIALACWVFITVWGAALVVLWAGLFRFFCRGWQVNLKRWRVVPSASAQPVTPATRVLIGTALWCGLESLWSLGTLYWTSLAYTQSPTNLAILHLGQLSGPALVTAAIVLVNGLLAEACLRKTSGGSESPHLSPVRYFGTAVGVLMILHLIGMALYTRPLVQPAATALKIGIVQGNIPTRIKLSSMGVQQAIARYTRGYEQLADQQVQAVLTPEAALPFLWNSPGWQNNAFAEAVRDRQVVAWLGTFWQQGDRVTQSLVTLTGSGVTSRYNKIKLVPLGEYIPFEELLGGLISRLSPIKSDLLAGQPGQQFDTPFGLAIASICYESAFPELFRVQAARGGQFILTASNLDPYNTAMKAQHQAQDLMRAIETDRWAVRATNTGYSGVIDPHGHIQWQSRSNQYDVHAETIYRRQTQTLYVRWGDWLTPLLLGLAGLRATYSLLRQPRH